MNTLVPDTDDLSKICPALWLSSMFSVQHKILQENGITHVLSVMPDSDNLRDMLICGKYQHLRIQEHDGDDTNLLAYFSKAVQFIDAAHSKGGSVLVHCVAGVSRSPTIIAAYLIHHYWMSTDEALAHIRTVRPFIEPKRAFVAQLREWEKRCHEPIFVEKLMWQKLDVERR